MFKNGDRIQIKNTSLADFNGRLGTIIGATIKETELFFEIYLDLPYRGIKKWPVNHKFLSLEGEKMFEILIGKAIYINEPFLVSNQTDVFQKPVVVQTIKDAENTACVIVNGSIVLSYDYALKLVDKALKLEGKV